MTEERKVRRAGGRRRQDVLKHVVEVLIERGFHQTRFKDVAAASGVAVSTLQVYFGSREDMLVEALRTSTEAEVAAMRVQAGERDDPWDRLVGLVDRGFATPVPVWRMLMEFWSAAARDEELRGHSHRLQALYRAPFVSALGEGIRAGAFRTRFDVEVLVDLIVTTLDGLLYPRVLGQPRPSDDGLRELLLEQLATTLEVER
ncbi:TetR/AcrR family transcriptional regulator [Spongiactinospora sp. 9N601]|uniref:TetR/AcrR family transcriptional regulator n=1 Tax=Spongiactinospora sp. 9N601 TaxID=3375149 RepID=UPI0037A5DCE9